MLATIPLLKDGSAVAGTAHCVTFRVKVTS